MQEFLPKDHPFHFQPSKKKRTDIIIIIAAVHVFELHYIEKISDRPFGINKKKWGSYSLLYLIENMFIFLSRIRSRVKYRNIIYYIL